MPSSACAAHHRALPSFPTRRSSDLVLRVAVGQFRQPRHRLLVSLPAVVELRQLEQRLAEFLRFGGDERVVVDDAEQRRLGRRVGLRDRKSTRLNSSHTVISYAVFCVRRTSPRSTLFPYTTLFRSRPAGSGRSIPSAATPTPRISPCGSRAAPARTAPRGIPALRG